MSEKKYIPDYSADEIIVFFKKDIPYDMPTYIAKKFGYEIIEREIDLPGIIFRFPEGKMDEAKEKFSRYNEFVKGFERRDLRFERRFQFQQNLEGMVSGLGDGREPKEEYFQYLEKIKKFIDKFKD
jgi:hypothetical protein